MIPGDALAPERLLLRPTYRVLNWTRLALALQALIFNLVRMQDEQVRHPVVLELVSVLMLIWTLIAWRLTMYRIRPHWWLQLADVSMTLILVLSSRVILGPELSHTSYGSVTVLWHVGAPLAVAVAWGSTAGLAAGVAIGLASYLQDPSTDPRNWTGAFALALICWGVGQLVTQLRVTVEQRDHQFARAAVLSERDRMARLVHDGALQVLSLVERDGPGLGPRGQHLARLAKTQEVHLRQILQDRSVAMGISPDEPVDIVSMIDRHGTDRVTVSTMAGAVLIDGAVAREVDAAVTQVLHNVAKHAGPDAEAWVLVEEGEGELIISIRDNGVGMSMSELAAALASDRMGMRASIRGRIEDLGGSARVSASPSRGVEWELVIPLPDAG